MYYFGKSDLISSMEFGVKNHLLSLRAILHKLLSYIDINVFPILN